MSIKFLAAAIIAATAAISPAAAASLDLSLFNLKQGALVAESDAVVVSVDGPNDFLMADVDDGVSIGFFTMFPSDPTSGFLDLVAPESFGGALLAFDIDATSAAGLFFDGTRHLYAVLTLPAGAVFDFSGAAIRIDDASAQLYDAAVIPLPAAAPLLLAGLGALAVAARRRKA